MAEVLRRLPQDGTFNQTQPFDRLVGSRHSFSFDLKSATDRWPLVFLFEVVQYLFDRSFASSVVNSAFACNIFEVPFVKLKRLSSMLCGRAAVGISRFLAYFRAITPYISVVVCGTGASRHNLHSYSIALFWKVDFLQ